MIRVTKGEIPDLLRENGEAWLERFLEDPRNPTNRYRYRDPVIKGALLSETSSKCIYCESKLGHNTPGDVEHKTPSSRAPRLHFEWMNLTIACTECNRRKNDYFDVETPFLDPNVDDVEERITHLGPIVVWAPGDATAELTLRTLELNSTTRIQLILRKVEKLEQLSMIKDRVATEASEPLRELLRARLREMQSADAEYAGMIRVAARVFGSPDS